MFEAGLHSVMIFQYRCEDISSRRVSVNEEQRTSVPVDCCYGLRNLQSWPPPPKKKRILNFSAYTFNDVILSLTIKVQS